MPKKRSIDPKMARWSMTDVFVARRYRCIPVRIFLGRSHVELDGAALPGSVEGIADMEVDFWTVESSIAFVDLIGLAAVI